MVAGYLSLLYSINEKPLEYWSKRQSPTGRIRKILDSDLLENVVEIQDLEYSNINSTSITCPSNPLQLLNIKLPFLVIVIKNLNIECRIRLQIIDNKDRRHHFLFSTVDLENETKIAEPTICRIKLKLESKWNKWELDLQSLTNNAFKCEFAAVQRLEICANCRLRRIYFTNRHYQDNEICTNLYRNFLDTYMQKWGINAINVATQANEKGQVVNGKDKEYTHSVSGNHLRKPDFLSNLQIKCNMVIDEFFGRQNIKLPNIVDFKRKTKIKSYAIPAVDTVKPKRNYTTGNSSMIFDKHCLNLNLLKDPSHAQILHDRYSIFNSPVTANTCAEQKAASKQEKWTSKYFSNKLPMTKNISLTEEKHRSQPMSFISSSKADDEKKLSPAENFLQKYKKDGNAANALDPPDSHLKMYDGLHNKYLDIDRSDLQTCTNPYHYPRVSDTKQSDPETFSNFKKDNVLHRTIFDMRRTYTDFMDKSLLHQNRS